MSTSTRSRPLPEGDSYHHGNLREALLKEGLTLLEETGETSFSLRELARRVGVTANAAYRHFANKEALLMALAEEGFRQFGNNQMQIWQATPGSTAARFLASGCGYVRFAREHPALFRLMFGRMAAEHRSGGLEKTSRQTFTQLLDGVARVVGLTPDAPEARLVAYNAWALVHGYSHLILDGQLDGEMKDLEQMVESALKRWMPGKLYF